MIYILTSGVYSDYSIDDFIELPEPLKPGDNELFEAWCASAETREAYYKHHDWKVGVDDEDDYERSWRVGDYSQRGWFLKKWLIENMGGKECSVQQVCEIHSASKVGQQWREEASGG